MHVGIYHQCAPNLVHVPIYFHECHFWDFVPSMVCAPNYAIMHISHTQYAGLSLNMHMSSKGCSTQSVCIFPCVLLPH